MDMNIDSHGPSSPASRAQTVEDAPATARAQTVEDAPATARAQTLEDAPATAQAEAVPAEAPQTEVGRRIKLDSVASDRETLVSGRRAFERGDDEVALENFVRLAAHGVRYADVHYMTGLLQDRRGESEAALTNLKEAVRINPSYVEALLALASLYEHRGDFDNSQAYAERARELSRGASGGLDPTTRGKLANQQAALADALAQAGERREAIAEYRRALDRCPTFHDIRHRLGITLREAGLPAQAAKEFTHILRAHPGLLESQIQLGLTYYAIGRTPDAIREWDAVLEKDPSRDEARMYLRLVQGSVREPAQAPDAAAESSVPDQIQDSTHDLSFTSVPPTPARERDVPGWSKTALSSSPTGETGAKDSRREADE